MQLELTYIKCKHHMHPKYNSLTPDVAQYYSTPELIHTYISISNQQLINTMSVYNDIIFLNLTLQLIASSRVYNNNKNNFTKRRNIISTRKTFL